MSQNPLHKTPLQPWQRSEVQRWHEELVRTTGLCSVQTAISFCEVDTMFA